MAERRSTIQRWGSDAWMILGVLALAFVVYTALAAMSGLVIPLVIAVVVGALGVPVVDWLERRRIPRALGSAIFLLALSAVLLAAAIVTVDGVIDQSDEIKRQVTAGLERVDDWLEGRDADFGSAESGVSSVERVVDNVLPGLASYVSTVFSGAISFLIGTFIGLFLLYYVLKDWDRLFAWLSQHLGVRSELGATILDDATFTLRQSFYALSLSSLVTAIVIGAAMVILGVPLAFTVAVVTFVTSYVPYLGAIFSGAFAFLVALGAEGPGAALILLAVILVVQNVVQTVVQTKLTSDRLSMHPIANLASTIVGAGVAGLLGATLSAPILATAIAIRRRVREDAAAEPTPPPADPIDDALPTA